MARIYSLISGKGGTGKTSSAINLGAALNLLGQEVVVVDTNLSTPNIGLYLGASLVPITLNHVLRGNANITDAIYEHKSGLKILPSSLSMKELKNLKYEKIQEVVKQLGVFSEFIILDSSAGLGKEIESSILAADEVILVTQAEMPAVTDALKAKKLAEQLNKAVKGFIITRYQGRKTEMSIESIKGMLESPLLGVVPEDKNMQKALALKNSIIYTHPKSIASKAYKEIARKILGVTKKHEFFSKFFGYGK